MSLSRAASVVAQAITGRPPLPENVSDPFFVAHVPKRKPSKQQIRQLYAMLSKVQGATATIERLPAILYEDASPTVQAEEAERLLLFWFEKAGEQAEATLQDVVPIAIVRAESAARHREASFDRELVEVSSEHTSEPRQTGAPDGRPPLPHVHPSRPHAIAQVRALARAVDAPEPRKLQRCPNCGEIQARCICIPEPGEDIDAAPAPQRRPQEQVGATSPAPSDPAEAMSVYATNQDSDIPQEATQVEHQTTFDQQLLHQTADLQDPRQWQGCSPADLERALERRYLCPGRQGTYTHEIAEMLISLCVLIQMKRLHETKVRIIDNLEAILLFHSGADISTVQKFKRKVFSSSMAERYAAAWKGAELRSQFRQVGQRKATAQSYQGHSASAMVSGGKLRVPYEIWKELDKEAQRKIQLIRDKLRPTKNE